MAICLRRNEKLQGTEHTCSILSHIYSRHLQPN